MTKTVLLLDGEQRSALAVLRSLGRGGYEVHVASSAVPCLSGSSRFAKSQRKCPDPGREPADFITWVRDTSRDLSVDFVFPVTDTSTMLLAPLRERWSHSRILTAPVDAYDLVSDKAGIATIAKQSGIRAPATVIAKGREEIAAAVTGMAMPVVIKPCRSRVMVDGSIIATRVIIASSQDDAEKTLRSEPWVGEIPCLVQEYVSGYGAGVFLLFANGHPCAWFAHRRVREKPVSGGVSVLSESVEVPAELLAASERLLRQVQWDGLAMLEFKVSPRGDYYLMEVNGRPWGSMQLAIDCGVDFPRLYVEAQSCETGLVRDFRRGRRLRWVLGDFDSLLLQLRDRSVPFADRWRAILPFLRTFFDFRCKQEVFRWSDPMPALRELVTWLRAAL